MLLLLLSQLLSVSYSALSEEGHQQGEAGAAGGRDGRSLVNSFPFTEARPAKQYDDGPAVDFNSVADATASGLRCIDKVLTIGKLSVADWVSSQCFTTQQTTTCSRFKNIISTKGLFKIEDEIKIETNSKFKTISKMKKT